MSKRVLLCLLLVLCSCFTAAAQQVQPQPLTFWYVYTVNPGREADFMDLIKSVGQPVRDKLMADGVVLAWGVEVPLLRVPGNSNLVIWYAVNDWSGVEKVDSAMRAQIAKLDEEAMKSGSAKKGQTSSGTVTERLRQDLDQSKTHDYLTRDLDIGLSSTAPSGILPYSRYNFVKVKPGKGAEYRKAWEKYNKPVFDKLLADGVLLGYGFAVEEVRTSGDFTHFIWMDTKDLAGMDKIRTAFSADREHRTQEEQDAIANLFAGLLDLDASRSEVDRSLIFHVPTPK